MSRWGRLYGGTRNHRKIKILRERFPNHWTYWYVLIDLAIEINDDGWIYVSPGVPYTLKELAKEIGIRREDTMKILLSCLEELSMITRSDAGVLLNSFKERNFISDSSTQRVQKYREKQKSEENMKRFSNVACNKGETAPEQKQNRNRTDTRNIVRNSSDGDNGFDAFWKVYPRKIGKKAAQTAWKKAKDKPPTDHIVQAVVNQRQSDQWVKDDGQFIPHPATWINQGRWDDEVVEVASKHNPYAGRCKHLNMIGKCQLCEKEKRNANHSSG